MLIVTESINADREPNKTHNEPSTARVPWSPWPLQGGDGDFCRIQEYSRFFQSIVSDKFRVTLLPSGPDQLFDVKL